MKPESFQITVTDAVLDDLRRRLSQTRWGAALPDSGWDHGTSPSYLKEVVAYWMSGYDWRIHEAALNQLPQFVSTIDGARIHFVHQRSRDAHALPLLLLHGWPDSFYRFHKVIPMLASPNRGDNIGDFAFDVVVPSLPGFGFTGEVMRASREQPNRQYAELLWRLMTEVLGYRRFAVAGGDGGSSLAQLLAIDHPESVIGIHLTDLAWHAVNVEPSTVPKHEREYLEHGKKQFMQDGAYIMVQTTKPQSLSPALNDSPSALAAWILDRFHSWCDCDGNIERSFTKDELLTNIMIYWVTQTIGSSMKTYFDETRSPSLTPKDHVNVPVALALFPKDIAGVPPRSFAERTLNVQRWTEMPRGGHFAAWEEPELYANDVTTFFHELHATVSAV